MHSVLRTRPGRRSRRRRSLALLAAPLLALPLLASLSIPAGAASPAAQMGSQLVAGSATSADPTAQPPRGGGEVKVTLITGNTVTWHKTGAQRQPVVDIDPAPRDDGQAVQFFSQGTSKDFYVFPSDVEAYLGSGVLDRELFNVPGLIRDGLADRSSDTMPVIVTFKERSTRPLKIKAEYAQLAADADSLPATTHPVPVWTLHGAGVQVDRGKADRFWEAIDGDGAASAQLDEGVEKVMLDRPVHVSLDESVPQIGAPEVWNAGYTGEGVTVAVLDTGIDTGHPDLAGRVTAEKNFTDSASTTDHHGHGTHVASTIAGSGAASDGQYTGVAPDADLMNGKVLADHGFGQISWIIAGMEWAAGNEADVVNMSLGACCGSDGTDPMAQAVNQLTAQYDTLFVIAAGNNGDGGLDTPGTADAALTVGAVDKADQFADFSSVGPRLNDFAVKPNISAPGVDITAARAAGTRMGSPVDDSYTTAGGTSMATPHVAGAAALLAQARPGLDAYALKNALASTAVDDGYLWREQGTGRVDVARAVNQGVFASASLDFGSLDDVTTPVTRELTYTNRTDSAVTLDLGSELENSHSESVANLTLSADTVTVPANGEATVTASINPADYQLGVFGGTITATGTDVHLGTAVGFGQLNAQDVTIKVLDSAGNPYDPTVGVWLSHDTYDADNPLGQDTYVLGTENGVATAKVPAGTYTLMTGVGDIDPATGTVARNSFIMKADVKIAADSTFTLDSRETVPVKRPITPRDVAVRGHVGALTHQSPHGGGFVFVWADFVASGAPLPIFVSPSSPAQLGTVSLSDFWVLAQPKPLKMNDLGFVYSDAPAYIYRLAFGYPNGIPDDIRHTVKRRDLVEVPSYYHSENSDAIIGISEYALPSHIHQGSFIHHLMWIRPGEVTEYRLADSRWFWPRHTVMLAKVPDQPLGFSNIFMRSGDRFMDSEAGARRHEEHWFEAPLHVGAADVQDGFLDYYADNPFGATRSATMARGGPDGNEFVTAQDLLDNSLGHSAGESHGGNWLGDAWASWRMWNADTGTELEPDHKYGAPRPVFHLSAEPATYRLQQVETYPESTNGLFDTRPSATTKWTFQSTRSEDEVARGYSCERLGGGNPLLDPIVDPDANLVCQFQPLIQLRHELDLNLKNQAAANRAHKLVIEAGAHPGAPDRARVTDLSVEYSTDGGQTWRDGTVLGKPKNRGGYQRFTVGVWHPRLSRTDGSVWLRVKAEDANGGTVTQTIQRAYLLK